MKSKNIGIVTGILVFCVFLILPVPDGLNREAMIAGGTALLMAIWWLTEAIPVFATSFVPLVLFPLFGVLQSKDVALSYGHNYVLMLLAGVIIAKAIEVQNLHKRIALITIRLIGVNKQKIILSFMLATAFLSMWIANVAVALMMLPIALSIIKKDEESAIGDSNKFAVALMLSIAYSASIGGIGSLIGTPPNLVFAGVIESLYPDAPQITFSNWMLMGLPLTIILLPITWFYMIKFFRIKGVIPGSVGVIKGELAKLGKISSGEKRVLMVFFVTALGWIFRKDLVFGDFVLPGWSTIIGASRYVHDATVGMVGVLLLFMVPSGNVESNGKKYLITWKEAESVPWGVVILVGGGYALAASFSVTGLAEWIGGQVTVLQSFSTLTILFLIVLSITFLTEINSNTATANIFMPILVTVAVANKVHPFLLMIPATFACSCAFMLPSGTGTNAAIFASERITIPQMARTGFMMNFIAILVITLVSYLIVVPLLDLNEMPQWVK